MSDELERLNRAIAIPETLKAEDGRVFHVTLWEPRVESETKSLITVSAKLTHAGGRVLVGPWISFRGPGVSFP